jgi:hypothetical protein
VKRQRLLTIALAASVAAVAAGCVLGQSGSSGQSGSPDQSPVAPTGSLGPARYQVATEADQLILRIDTDGGLVAPGFNLSHLPELSLYGDGRVFFRHSGTYPAPLYPNLDVAQITPDEIQKVVAAADAAGLLGPDATFNLGGIMDAPTTTFTTTVAGKTHLVSAYALGMESAVETSDPAILEARARLLDFDKAVSELTGLLGRDVERTAYRPASMRLFVSPSTAQDTASEQRDWPLAADPQTGEDTRVSGIKCVLLTGDDLGTFLSAAEGATLGTVWKAPSGLYFVATRSLYPDDSGCATGVGRAPGELG